MRNNSAMAVAILLALPAVMVAQDRPQYNWVMHCQGCHGANAQGTPGGAPRMAGSIARFLQIKAGRAYLGRVPGVAFVNLSDAELAELLTWVVQRFDAEHVPKNFVPYSEEEIKMLRLDPLISNANLERQKLLQLLSP